MRQSVGWYMSSNARTAAKAAKCGVVHAIQCPDYSQSGKLWGGRCHPMQDCSQCGKLWGGRCHPMPGLQPMRQTVGWYMSSNARNAANAAKCGVVHVIQCPDCSQSGKLWGGTCHPMPGLQPRRQTVGWYMSSNARTAANAAKCGVVGVIQCPDCSQGGKLWGGTCHPMPGLQPMRQSVGW